MAGSAQTQQPPSVQQANPKPAAGLTVLETSLTKLAPVGKVTLRDIYDTCSFSLPVPARLDIRSMTLRFGFTNSSALLPENSRLVLSVGGKPVGQVPLDPRSPDGIAEVAIPPALLKPGYVPCTFSVSQHATRECEDHTAPELWTVLDLDQATVRVEYAPRPLPRVLSSIDAYMLDPRNFLGTPLHVVVPAIDEAFMTLAARAASAAAVKLDFRAPEFSVSGTVRPGMDNIVIGPNDFVSSVLGPALERPEAASLRLVPLDGEGVPVKGAHAAVVLSGPDPASTELAVNAFCLMEKQFPDVPRLDVRQADVPVPGGPRGRESVLAGKEYRFKSLGVETVTFANPKEWGQSLRLRLPSEIYPAPNSMVELSLHLAYGSGARPESAMRVLLNGGYVATVPLDNPKGASFQSYKLTIPASEFRRGVNTLLFKPVVRSSSLSPCDTNQLPIPLTLFSDSVIALPRLSTWVDMPRLDLMFEDAFPYGKHADLSGTTLYCLDDKPGTLAASLDLVALLSQKTAFPAMGLKVALNKPAELNPMSLVVGPADSLPPALAQAMAFSPAKLTQRPLPQSASPRGTDIPSLSFLSDFFTGSPHAQNMPDVLPGQVRHDGLALEGRALLAQLRTPGTMDGVTLVLTAGTDTSLEAGALALAEGGFQAGAKGDTALINLDEPDKSRFMELAPKFYLGSAGFIAPLDRYLNARPWLMLGLAVAALVVFTFTVHRLLVRRIRRREGGS